MPEFKQYQVVRVKDLLQDQTEYDGWEINQRPPNIGDDGVLLDILSAPCLPDRYVVECVNSTNGSTIWLGVFLSEEIEVLK